MSPVHGNTSTQTLNTASVGGYLSAEDHHIQDALELFVVADLQQLAELNGCAASKTHQDLHQAYVAALAANGHTPESVGKNSRHKAYLSNAKQAVAYLFERLRKRYPGAFFAFTATGKSGRLERRKGDIDIHVLLPDGQTKLHRVSWKNYSSGVSRIQVSASTFNSFALAFILPSPEIGLFLNPIDGSTHRTAKQGFREWRDAAIAACGYPEAVPYFRALDRLNDEMRALFLEGDTYRFFDAERFNQERKRVGAEGARLILQILETLPREAVRQKLLKNIGFDGTEDLLVVGGGQIAESITDTAFSELVGRVREAELRMERRSQTLHFEFVDDDGVALEVQVPCTINANGAWWRPRERHEGTRWHPKEKRHLAWGERRPKKCRELATSINTYVNLKPTGVLRDLPNGGERRTGTGSRP